MSVVVRQATIEDLEHLAPLFDSFRQFCQKKADVRLAHAFLAERIQREESLILVAELSDRLAGFTQLYPSFSSVDASRTFILSDLFVAPEARRKGVAQALLAKATQVARTQGAASLSLSTARANKQAQKLYESQGWEQDDFFFHYNLAL
ncbi:GNAT family N-acetyltransferase [Oleiagrimonas sp. MCCC 1A03011]|uniref:GNAT family N-acetyltransferase n=1 Tax=Oleiagrimonas sp. MCCC 1A03011 TaxID=1926883 RepID=UPI000DC2BD32|nr:GNAT family N-acetyltransferase [Oleiagrimonas sp. MCCC 1A03011]RAP57344.1 GNAT family N-acetyltransferase [Oleiagrimonas sp. MCCC 1A03011]